MENKEENIIRNYNEVLSENEIVKIGLIIRKFEREQISYKQLNQLLKDENVELTPHFHEFTKFRMSTMEQEEKKKRFETKQYDAGDFDGYLISGNNYKNVLIKYDRQMIDILAKNGDEDAIRTRNILVKWEERSALQSSNHRKK